MSARDEIEAAGEVIELRPDGVARVRLANGHVLVARLARTLRRAGGAVAGGDAVVVALSPSDLSKGWIRRKMETT